MSDQAAKSVIKSEKQIDEVLVKNDEDFCSISSKLEGVQPGSTFGFAAPKAHSSESE